jgi:NitT/TauT family transport system substrate-binding protein
MSLAVVAALALSGLAGCGLGTASTPSTIGQRPELSTIRFGVLNDSSYVTAQIAQDEGFFRQEGFSSVDIVRLQTTNASSAGLLSHTLDFAAQNYIGLFEQERTIPSLNLRVVADNAQATPDLYVMMVPKGSPIRSMTQLEGKTVGCPALGYNYCQLALDVWLKPYGLSEKDVKQVAIPFADTPLALSRGAVDAAFTTEPYSLELQMHGANILQDLMSGVLAGFPQNCYVTTASFLAKYPRTVRAFQLAMSHAAALADTNTPLVRKELVKFIPTLSPNLAAVMMLPRWNSVLALARMQRASNLLENFGELPRDFDVKQLYVPTPTGT